jgi:hypothetical protein
MTKICSKCGLEKELSEFNKNRTKKDGYASWCRECNKLYKQKYREENAEKIAEAKKKCYHAKIEQYKNHHKENYYKHQAERIAYTKKWREENRDRHNATVRKYRAEHPEVQRARDKRYREKHREEIRLHANNYNRSKFCKNFQDIENYNLALADNFKGWDKHHRLETHNSNGERRLVDLTREELKALGMYYDRPAEELIFLRTSEHISLHREHDKKINGLISL